MTAPPLCTPPDPQPRRPKNEVPSGACDCHFHVFDLPSPQVDSRSYTAPRAPLSAYKEMQAAVGLQRAVIVQPSIYGTDNRTTLQNVTDTRLMKSIVVVNDDTDLKELRRLGDNGAAGVRANMLFSSDARLGELKGLAGRMADLGWHLQVLADISCLPDLEKFVKSLPIPVVFDHMGHVPIHKGVSDPGFQSLLQLLNQGLTWVKLSGAYRLADPDTKNYAHVAPMAQALVSANPDQLVWGSDWPHPSFNGPMPNDGDLVDLLFDWVDKETANKILVDNPERLYGFPKWETTNGI
ncbi:MAG: amidohydrolase family protein [Rhizobiaceae bacterium]